MKIKSKDLRLIVFILVLSHSTLCYKYNFSQYSGSTVCNQDSTSCNPKFSSGYNGSGTDIMKLRQGVMILSGNVVSSNSGMNQGSTGTLCFTFFIFNVNQQSTLYTSTSTNTKNSYLNLMINNGKMRIESGTYSGGSYVASPTKETSSSSMYSTGWNLICYTLSNTNFNFYSYPRFATLVVTESATNTTFLTISGFIGIFGGLINSAGTSFSNSFQGIIHTIDIQSTTYTSTSIASNFLVPTSSPFTICDYFIGMFTNLSVQDASNAFTNLMYNHYSQTQQFTNSLSSTVDTNGLAFSNGQTQTITNVKVTSQRAIGVQLWAMGGFTNNVQIASISKNSSNKGSYVYRDADNIVVGSTYSGATVTFSNAISTISSSNWIFIGFSIGWMGTNNDFMLCGYIYQPSSAYESGDCASSISISTTDFGSGVTLYVELGSGISGYVKEVYITNHLEHFHIFKLFKNTFGVTRYDCYEEFNYDPHYIRQGCGNGHILPTESSEQCDDGNTSSSDGCSSSCTIENLYKCVNTIGLSPVSTCTYTCGNSNYEPQYAEGCDDGNTSNNDGCSSLCVVETGWTCTNISGSKSTCSTICGDGRRLGTEACDDGNASDNKGCKPDCSGMINGWHCSGGTATTADICTEQCGDGYITVSEQCDDGNTNNGDGCSSTCLKETGWTCKNNDAMTSSVCTTICGDGIIKGTETCDDGNSTDNRGCTSDSKGIIKGWYCSSSTYPASVCVTHCGDGIHVSPDEGCDDGNSVNSGDGCTNSCTIEDKWDCSDDILQRSVCVPRCGNGKINEPYETCDDANTVDGDGCSSKCLIESGWQCFNGTSTTADNCYKQPVASIDSVSSNNIIKVKFSEKIKSFQPLYNSSYTISVSGPYSPYQFSVTASFIDEYTLSFNLTFASQMFGQNQETIKISFTQSEFLSNNGASLYNSYLETSLNKISLAAGAVSAMGSSINNAMGISIVIMITSNILLGQSSELLWGFLSTIQIIYFFPLLNLYFPDNFSSLLACFSASTLQLPIPSSFSLQSNIESQTNLSDKLNMPALNERYESLNYQSTGILLTGCNVFNVFGQGIVVCIIVYGLRAILFTLRVDSGLYEKELNEIEQSNQIQVVENNNSENIKPKESKLRILIKKKIKEMSCEYRYNFFLRTGGQVFLEASIFSLLNIRYMQAQNFYQVLSIIVSFAFLGVLLLFYVWTMRFACIHYNDYKYREKIDIQEYESMFGQYKTKYLPQTLFNTYFMTRRILYACIIVFLIDFPIFQAFTFMLICLPILAYHIIMNPYISKINNIVMNINEFSFVFIGTTFYVFSEPMSNTSQQTILGWVDIGIIMSVCIFNFIVLWSLKIIMTYYQCKEWWQAFKEKQRLKKIKKLKEYRGTNENLQKESNNIPEFYTMRCTREKDLLPSKILKNMNIKPSQFYKLNNISQRNNKFDSS